MRIGELATKVGVPVATIRYYEQQGLLDEPSRSDSNYRHYGPEATQRLRFIVQCRSLDISMAEIRQLLDLVKTPDANCADVDRILDQHILKVRQQRRALARLEKELVALRSDCHPSKQVRGCAILRDSALVEQSKGRELENQ